MSDIITLCIIVIIVETTWRAWRKSKHKEWESKLWKEFNDDA